MSGHAADCQCHNANPPWACTCGKDLRDCRAENQRLRDALEAMRELASVSTDGDGWYAEQAGVDADAIFTQAREALAGDAE